MTDKTDKMPVKQLGKGEQMAVRDTSSFSNFLDTAKFEHLWRVAQGFSKTRIVPKHYQNQPWDCALAIHMAVRLKMDPVSLMQSTHVIHGSFGMDGKLAAALINGSGLYDDDLDYEFEGECKKEKGQLVNNGYRCRAFTFKNEKQVNGPWVDTDMVISEGWATDKVKDGVTYKSKWNTLTDMMFMYRSATFFGRVKCPQVLMGLQTVDELDDIEEIEFEEVKKGPRSTAQYLDEQKQKPAESTESDDLPETSDTPVPEESAPVDDVAQSGGDSEEDAEDTRINDEQKQKEDAKEPEVDTETGEVKVDEKELLKEIQKKVLDEMNKLRTSDDAKLGKFRKTFKVQGAFDLKTVDAAQNALDWLLAK